ncbi:MAG: hypothetical protein KGJ84_05150 [Elusimicrobia bacterium]|nr:hypothetical protein [Elusimicrobiota bacterium]
MAEAPAAVPSAESMTRPSPYGAMSAVQYRAAILHEPAAMRQVVSAMSADRNEAGGVLQDLYLGLASIYDGAEPEAERARAASTALERYGAFLGAIERHPDMPVWLRKNVARTRQSLVRTGAALHGMAWARQESGALDRTGDLLSAADHALVRTPVQQPTEPAPSALPVNGDDRIAAESESVEIDTMRGDRDLRKSLEFALEKALTRLELGRRRDVSTRQRANLVKDLSAAAEAVRASVPGLRASAAYWRDATYAMAFAAHRPGRVVWRPRSPGLELVAEPGGWRIEASFESDVRDPARLRAVKAVIEETWRGEFSWRGERMRIRTVVRVDPIPENTRFSGRRLVLKDAGEGTSMARQGVIYLAQDGEYMEPAHEFGHILGLADDYSSRLIPEDFAREIRSLQGSIMGDRNGVAQERLLRRAYLLLHHANRQSDRVRLARMP